MTLQMFCGLMNSGKTIIMTYEGYKEFRRGKTVYTNYHVNFPHRKINKDYIFYLAEKQPNLDNTCFLLDELWIWLDCRDSQSNRIATYFFLQSSKDDNHIKLTSQSFGQSDKRIKDNFHSLSMCERVLKINGKYLKFNYSNRFLPEKLQDILYIQETKFVHQSNISNSLKIDRITFYKAKPLFDLYNTKEKIKTR